MIFDLITTLLVVAVVGLLLIGLLAPMESLGWWAGWSGESHLPPPETGVAQPKHVLVYLSGIGSISGDELLAEEARFLDHIQALLPDVVIVRDVFPYSVKGWDSRARGRLPDSGSCSIACGCGVTNS